jgi:hypothetical protein
VTAARDHRLELLTVIARQILGMAVTGPVDHERVEFCTAGRYSTADLKSALAMLHAGGMINYRAGKYYAVTTTEQIAAAGGES